MYLFLIYAILAIDNRLVRELSILIKCTLLTGQLDCWEIKLPVLWSSLGRL